MYCQLIKCLFTSTLKGKFMTTSTMTMINTFGHYCRSPLVLAKVCTACTSFFYCLGNISSSHSRPQDENERKQIILMKIWIVQDTISFTLGLLRFFNKFPKIQSYLLTAEWASLSTYYFYHQSMPNSEKT